MDTTTVAHEHRLDTREERALALYHARGREIERIAPNVYLVPSCSGDHAYRVDLSDESCNCPDARRHPDLNCKHILAAAVKRAKRRGTTARRLAALEAQYQHELLDDETRLELLGEIRALRRRVRS